MTRFPSRLNKSGNERSAAGTQLGTADLGNASSGKPISCDRINQTKTGLEPGRSFERVSGKTFGQEIPKIDQFIVRRHPSKVMPSVNMFK